jgi:hypothetical protein
LFENYTQNETNGVTEGKVDLEVTPEFEDDLQQTWPKALGSLMMLCES